ncbi:hypothetical protein KSP40_PGU003039 [Platanthera guangdongensis]|uniref:Uncharacterized protein n=1 Tax=Platanthera guangdongensis TaxID=2320717 RepID=A0ABR2MMY8_9ASPA
MVGFFMAYFVDSLSGIGLVDQMGNFFCKILLLIAVGGVMLIRKNEDIEKLKKLFDETTFYDKQWQATWQDDSQIISKNKFSFYRITTLGLSLSTPNAPLIASHAVSIVLLHPTINTIDTTRDTTMSRVLNKVAAQREFLLTMFSDMARYEREVPLTSSMHDVLVVSPSEHDRVISHSSFFD